MFLRRLLCSMLTLCIVILFIPSIGDAQTRSLWDESITSDASGSDESERYKLNETRRGFGGDFFGRICVLVDVDSIAGTDDGENDSLYFISQYKISGNWYDGDTMQFDALTPDEIDSTMLDRNRELIIVQTHQDTVWFWTNDPTSTTTIEGFPAYDEFGVKVLYGDSVDFVIDADVGVH